MPSILPLNAIDSGWTEELLDRAFGEARQARTAYRIREGTEPLGNLCFAAMDDNDYIVATIQAWPVGLTDAEGKPHPLIMVGPVAVLPERQGEGFGKALITAQISVIDDGATPARPALPQVLIGDAAYYGAWGYTAQPTQGWRCPGPYDGDRLLVRADNPAILPASGLLGPWNPPRASQGD